MNTMLLGSMRPDFTPMLILLLCIALASLQGCAFADGLQAPAQPRTPRYGLVEGKASPVSHQGGEAQIYAASIDCSHAQNYLAPLNYRVDKPLSAPASESAPAGTLARLYGGDLPLSPGDLIQVALENGEGFSGRYVIAANGYVNIPLVAPIYAQGLGVQELSEKIELALVRGEIFRPGTMALNIQILQLADIEVFVSGAVFEAGRVQINDKIPAQVMQERIAASGDYSATRLLSEALRAASGVRPDAKLDQVRLIRNGWQLEVDMSGILSGQPVQDLALVAGDQVIVPTSGCFQPHLVRPSQITPKGFRVFMSNLIEPSQGNAAAGVGSFASSLPYGTRLLQAAVSANCIGGKQWTNAPRKVLLATNNPLTNEVQVLERSVEQLIRNPQKDAINPYVMPNDAVACYDSSVSNIRDLARSLSDLIAPFKPHLLN